MVNVVAGVLTIASDPNDDAVQVSGDSATSTSFIVKGLSGTKVNGMSGPQRFSGVINGITSMFSDGKDFFSFSDSNKAGLAGNLLVDMGIGSDEVDLGQGGVHDYGGSNVVTKVNGDCKLDPW